MLHRFRFDKNKKCTIFGNIGSDIARLEEVSPGTDSASIIFLGLKTTFASCKKKKSFINTLIIFGK
jgi:hypothetical protein